MNARKTLEELDRSYAPGSQNLDYADPQRIDMSPPNKSPLGISLRQDFAEIERVAAESSSGGTCAA